MDAKIKEMWLTALRSGEYKQHIGALRGPSQRFCCLGVLCDLHAQNNNNTWVDGYIYLGRTCFLPLEVVEWAGLERSNPITNTGTTLTSHNDSGKSFSEIADIIESSL